MRWNFSNLWQLLQRTVREWNRDDGSQMAAALAYYAAFSFFPLILVLLAGLGYVLQFTSLANEQDRQTRLVELLGQNTSPELAQEIGFILGEVQSNARFGGPVGLAALLLGAIGIFASIDSAFIQIWRKEDHEPVQSIWWAVWDVLFHRLKAFVMLLGLGVMIILAFGTSIALTALRSHARGLPISESTWHEFQVLAGIALNAIFFTVIYKVLAKGPCRWLEAAAGGLLTAAAWEIGRQVLALFVVADKYTAYGVVGSFIALMVWFYYASTVLIFGAELVQVASRMRQEHAQGS